MSDNLPPLPHHIMVENIWTLETFIMTGENPKEAWEAMKSLRAIAAIEADRVSLDVPATPERDAIAVNLLRHAGLDKHKARECADIVLLMLAASPQPQPVQPQPSVAFLLRDLSDEIGVEVPRLSSTLASLGHGNYSTNMEVPEVAANAARFYFGVAQPKPANQQKDE